MAEVDSRRMTAQSRGLIMLLLSRRYCRLGLVLEAPGPNSLGPHRMSALKPTTYRVEAYNLSHASENKIHDDAVAQKLGFVGGLVPGVEVYAYACHPAVERWGRAW